MSTDAFTTDAEYWRSPPRSVATGSQGAFALMPISASDPLLEYCLRLAHQNMSPYLERRGEKFDDERWRQTAPQAEFHLVTDNANWACKTIGFVSVRRDPDCPPALHIGDVQIEPPHQKLGAGSAALHWIEDLARSRGLTELTLNVFRDNPALRLYERFGFHAVDTQFYKYKMRKTL
jgi:GNAT superfamily N-acetyltransferase